MKFQFAMNNVVVIKIKITFSFFPQKPNNLCVCVRASGRVYV